MTHRMFAALVPPADVVADLERFLEPRFEVPDWSWTSPESWHITLAFLGEVEGWRVEPLVASLRLVARRPITVHLEGGLAFPDAAASRVLALQARSEPVDGLDRLAETVRAHCAHAGVEVDGAHFRPHVTLGRSNRRQNSVQWLELLDTWTSRDWVADEFVLVESHLGEGPRGRARHEVVARIPMA